MARSEEDGSGNNVVEEEEESPEPPPKPSRRKKRHERLMRPLTSLNEWRRRRARLPPAYRRPSVALADYEISDTRTSAMSSLLLLFAILEGMCGFVLPICSAFSKPVGGQRHIYYEYFLFFQYGLSILALCYLQALIFYYDQKANYCQKINQKFAKHKAKLTKRWPQSREYLANHIDQSHERLALRYEKHTGVESSVGPGTPATPESSVPQATPEQHAVSSCRPSANMQVLRYPRFAHSMPQVTFAPSPSITTEANRATSADLQAKKYEQDSQLPHLKHVTMDLPPNARHFKFATLDTPLTERHFFVEDVNDGERDSENKREMDSEDSSTTEGDPDKRSSVSNDSTPQNMPPVRSFRHKLSSVVPLQFLFGDDPRGIRPPTSYFSRDTEGVSLYLRLGAVGFGFGVMVFDGFKIAEPWETRMNEQGSCHNQLWIPIHVVHFTYVFWQTYFLFKHHQVVFNVQKFVLRFLLCHLAVANLCQWLKTIVDEIGNEPHESTETVTAIFSPALFEIMENHSLAQNGSDDMFGVNISAEPHATMQFRVPGHGCKSTAKILAPYLFPCAIEYSLIAGAMFYKMFQKVGHVRQEFERLERIRQANTVSGHFAECHRSHRGLFIGLLLFMITLVSMCLFFIFFGRQEKRNTAITLYQCTELVLLGLSTLTCVLTMVRLRVLHLSNLSEEGAFDDNLLLVGLVGMIFYDLFLLVPALEALPSGKIAAKLFAAKALLEIAQSMIQVFFILEGSRRCAGSLAHVHNKPGRTLITFLLILNLAMWFVNTFEVKRADNHSIHIDYYTGMAWKIITHISLPMIVFFRFHSTVCLSDIWANAYRFRAS